ncbi:MAG: bifunctional hydroxymethylpyrimidine kinase/phosphomethylpyrimidine kinase [Nitrospirota bacterium]
MAYQKQVLTIAGFDPSGGAGIAADMKTFSAHGVFGLSVATAIAIQNTQTLTRVFDLPVSIIEEQIDLLFSDFDIAAVKTGMLFSQQIVESVVSRLIQQGAKNIVVDPVMVSKSGAALLAPDAVLSLKENLLPICHLVTPNCLEAERMMGRKVETLTDAKFAAEAIFGFGPKAVLIKGGHLLTDSGTDLLFDGTDFTIIPGEYIATRHTHGTGCTYASAIAARLALGDALMDAVFSAKRYMTEAIRNALEVGHGIGPVDPLWNLPPFGKEGSHPSRGQRALRGVHPSP